MVCDSPGVVWTWGPLSCDTSPSSQLMDSEGTGQPRRTGLQAGAGVQRKPLPALAVPPVVGAGARADPRAPRMCLPSPPRRCLTHARAFAGAFALRELWCVPQRPGVLASWPWAAAVVGPRGAHRSPARLPAPSPGLARLG